MNLKRTLFTYVVLFYNAIALIVNRVASGGKYTKLPKNIPNGHKKCLMSVK
jgi:hypothetical protein